jgi:hypothetical protein
MNIEPGTGRWTQVAELTKKTWRDISEADSHSIAAAENEFYGGPLAEFVRTETIGRASLRKAKSPCM